MFMINKSGTFCYLIKIMVKNY